MDATERFLNECAHHVDVGFTQQLVLPGDYVDNKIILKDNRVRLGQGLEVSEETAVYATTAGILSHSAPSLYWVENNSKWYSPVTGDQVVGAIEDKTGDFYRVNIGSGMPCILSRVCFEGATKRNKPELKIGDSVYCRVSLAHKDLETELTCVSSGTGSKKEWSTGETVYGPLQTGGVVVKCSIGFAKKLLQAESPLLLAVAKCFPYEIAIGVNGFVWYRTGSTKDSIVLWTTLTEADRRNLDDYHTEALVDVLVKRIKSEAVSAR